MKRELLETAETILIKAEKRFRMYGTKDTVILIESGDEFELYFRYSIIGDFLVKAESKKDLESIQRYVNKRIAKIKPAHDYISKRNDAMRWSGQL